MQSENVKERGRFFKDSPSFQKQQQNKAKTLKSGSSF